MVSIPHQSSYSVSSGQAIARIVGFTCLFGFLADMIALTFPLGSGAAWRVGVLQQAGDRGIVLLFALALILFSFLDQQQMRKPFAYAAMVIGILFLLSSILVIRDGLNLQTQAIDRIGQQAQELQAQVEQSKSDPEITANVSPDEFEAALQQINAQAETLKQNAKSSLTKTSISSISNLVVVGVGLLSLGRFGIGGGSAPRQAVRKSRR